VVIENRPRWTSWPGAMGPKTLIYADPPYVHDTRSQKRIDGALEHAYAHEMSEADHLELLSFLDRCASMVVLSGYGCPLYDEALTGWRRVEIDALADGARKRVEVLWINPAAARALDRAGAMPQQSMMFEAVA
jgi:DNA adenine methylase